MQSMKEGIQVIYQDLALFPNMSVAENISLNQRMEKREKFINWKKMRNLAIEELKNIGKNINPDELVEDLSVARQADCCNLPCFDFRGKTYNYG